MSEAFRKDFHTKAGEKMVHTSLYLSYLPHANPQSLDSRLLQVHTRQDQGVAHRRRRQDCPWRTARLQQDDFTVTSRQSRP
jgi:hypothetical protein